MSFNQRGSLLLLLIMLVMIVLIVGGVFFVWQKTKMNIIQDSAGTATLDNSQPAEIISEPGMQPQSVNVDLSEDDFKALDADLNQL